MEESDRIYDSISEELMYKIAGEIVLSKMPGETMKKWRILFELSQTELAKHMGISPSVLSDYEKNRRRSPGSAFIKKFVNALIAADIMKQGVHIRKFVSMSKNMSNAILDIGEFPRAVSVKEILKALDAVMLTGEESSNLPIYGYTVIDSLNAIKMMDATDFLKLFGSNSMRVLVFVGVERGRSPLIAVRIYPIKPRMIVIHGPKRPEDVDRLGIELATKECLPFALSLKQDVQSLIDALRALAK